MSCPSLAVCAWVSFFRRNGCVTTRPARDVGPHLVARLPALGGALVNLRYLGPP